MGSHPDKLSIASISYLDKLSYFSLYSHCVAKSGISSGRVVTDSYLDKLSSIIGSHQAKLSSFPVYSDVAGVAFNQGDMLDSYMDKLPSYPTFSHCVARSGVSLGGLVMGSYMTRFPAS